MDVTLPRTLLRTQNVVVHISDHCDVTVSDFRAACGHPLNDLDNLLQETSSG